MASSSVPTNPTSQNVAVILPKLVDPDPDIRYMTLNDLHKMLDNGHSNFLAHDFTTCTRVIDGIRTTLLDSNGDVQNMAIKALGSFIPKAPETILCPTIEKISYIQNADTLDSTIAALALRAIVVALAHPVEGMPRTNKVVESYAAISKALIPRLLGRTVIMGADKKNGAQAGMVHEDIASGKDTNSLDLVIEVARYFGSMLQRPEIEALETITVEVLQNPRCGSVMKKKAVTALATLAPYFDDALLSKHVGNSIEYLRQSHLTSQQRRLYITTLGSLARSIPQKFGPYLTTLTPFVLAPLSQQELDEQRAEEIEAEGDKDAQIEDVREAALTAIESFLQVCTQDMMTFTKEVIESAARFLKYEPNIADDDDEDDDDDAMEEAADDDDEDFEAEEDFEEETGFEDEDDVSWKVRRGSAKAFSALIQVLDPKDPLLFSQVAPALVARFVEREESVRNEVITTLSQLIRKLGPSAAAEASVASENAAPTSRKRRRGFSDSLGTEFLSRQSSIQGNLPLRPEQAKPATAGLNKLTPEIMKGTAKLLRTSTISTKQAAISMLRDLTIAEGAGLSAFADLIVDPVIDAMKASTASSVSNLAGNSLSAESLRLLKTIADTYNREALQPYLGKIVPELVRAAKERFTKVTLASLSTIESLIRPLTTTESTGSKDASGHVLELYNVLVDRITASETDTEVRQKAISVLGLLIGRTSSGTGSGVLSQKDRYAGQEIIAERLKNELTRLSAVKAVDSIAVLAQDASDFAPEWIGPIALELGAQFRKASRSLRNASLNALKMIALNSVSRDGLSEATIAELVNLIVPLLKTDDLHMLSPALTILSAFAKYKPQLVSTSAVEEGLCRVMTSQLSGAAIDAALTFVEALGRGGGGKTLMTRLLNVGTQGDTDITGQVIGTLLVSGGNHVGVGLNDFIKELQTQDDEAKKCLALSVLGEVGLRLGSQSQLSPQNFTSYFDAQSEKVRLAAAIALGRAGAGDVATYLPQIISALSQDKQYLLLHSVKELLQHSQAEVDVKPFTQALWQNIATAGQNEDNKVVGAECLGRLAVVDPTVYLPQLQDFLQHSYPTIRGMVISALRYIFADTDAGFDIHLRGIILPMLSTMLQDTDLENQRLSLSTLYSAFRSKPDLVMPYLSSLLPTTLQATFIRPELVREVQMGPFKHKVDDGLEIRKSAYETLYALLESPASRLHIDLVALYDRIIAGLADEHEIKILCCLVLSKLLVITPAESARRLDSLAARFTAILSFKPKENAVKQELEKLGEQNKAVVKTSIAFSKALATVENKAWKDYFEFVKKDFPQLVKTAEEELKDSRDR